MWLDLALRQPGALVGGIFALMALFFLSRLLLARRRHQPPADNHASTLAISAESAGKRASGRSSGPKPRHFTREPYISVVIPCYNEEGNIRPMHERLSNVLRPLTNTFEIIFVNNGSYDGSAPIFDEVAAADSHVSVLTLSRNFGTQGAYTSGMEYASGDCVVCMDGDIQDPPELIPAFVEKWRAGYDVVYGVRARRKGSLIRRIGYKAFYRLLQRVSYVEIPLDAGEFSLMDRRVVDVVNAMPERNRLIRGLRAWAGFHQTGVPYVRQERFSGRTTNSLFALFRWAGLGLISFSFAPLELISYLAAVVVLLTALAIVYYLALYFIVPTAPRGFETILVVVLFLGAVQLLCLSIMGSYLARMFEEIKARPKYLIQDISNDHRSGAEAPSEHGARALGDTHAQQIGCENQAPISVTASSTRATHS
jgi:polyisoprenyl-phosphate glycosyltransferase